MSQLLASDDQNPGVSTSASVLPVSIQGWFPLRLTCFISLLAKGLSGVLSSTTVQRHQFLGTPPSLQSSSHSVCDQWEDDSFDFTDLCRQSNFSVFNTLSRFVVAFLPRGNCLLISWLQSPFAVILEPKKRKSVPTSTFPFYLPWSNGARCHGLRFLILSFKLVLSLSSFTLKRLFSSSSLSAIRVVSSVYLRLLMFLPPILIPAWNSSCLAFLMMCSAYRLNKQGDSRQLCCTPFSILNQ